MKYLYIAGPYAGLHHDYRSYFEIDRNIQRATEAAALLAAAGVGFFNPHGHSAHFETIVPSASKEYWYELDINFMKACDAILMLPNWEKSTGSLEEKRLMEAWGKPVFYDLEEAVEWAQS